MDLIDEALTPSVDESHQDHATVFLSIATNVQERSWSLVHNFSDP